MHIYCFTVSEKQHIDEKMHVLSPQCFECSFRTVIFFLIQTYVLPKNVFLLHAPLRGPRTTTWLQGRTRIIQPAGDPSTSERTRGLPMWDNLTADVMTATRTLWYRLTQSFKPSIQCDETHNETHNQELGKMGLRTAENRKWTLWDPYTPNEARTIDL